MTRIYRASCLCLPCQNMIPAEYHYTYCKKCLYEYEMKDLGLWHEEIKA